MVDEITNLFCNIDDFCKIVKQNSPALLGSLNKRGPKSRLTMSEIMTIYTYYHSSGFKNFKAYYLFLYNCQRSLFPNMVSYNRFVELIPTSMFMLLACLYSRMGKPSYNNFIDSTSVMVCKNKRIKRNKVFKDFAAIGKTSIGWFFGFKLHLMVNEYGELLAFTITPGNVSDTGPVAKMCKLFKIMGKIFGDKGYISSELFQELFEKGVQLFTGLRSNMKNKLMNFYDKIMLRKRAIIETIIDQLKNISDIEHSRHRSVFNFFSNMLGGLLAYTFKDKKPCIKLAGLRLITPN